MITEFGFGRSDEPRRKTDAALSQPFVRLGSELHLVTQWLMAIIASGSGGVASGLLLAAAFALVTATWVWTLPETRGIALRNE